MNQTSSLRGERPYLLALAAMILVYLALLTYASFNKLNLFAMGFDLGMYEQVIWNTAHGRLFATSAFAYTQNHLGSDPILLEALLAPIYAVFPSTYTLLFLQTAALGLAAVPLYLLARDKLGAPLAGVGFALCWLLYVPLAYLNLDEFQPRAFALPLAIAAFYFLEKKRLAYFLLCCVLMLATRSDVALFVIMLGVYALISRKPKWFVLAPILLGAAWFYLAVFVIVPRFKTTPGGFVYFETYKYLGDTPGEMLLTVITRPLFVLENVLTPGKLNYLAQLFGPVGFLSLLRPDLLLLAAPTLAFNLLSPQPLHWSIRYQYGSMIYPVAFCAAVMGIVLLLKIKPLTARVNPRLLLNGALGWLVLTTLAANVWLGNPAVPYLMRGPTPRTATANAVIARVPPDAKLAVSSLLAPHLAQREGFYFFPPHEFYTNNPVEMADYILIDLRTDGDDPVVPKLRKSADWQVLFNQDDYLLLKRQGAR